MGEFDGLGCVVIVISVVADSGCLVRWFWCWFSWWVWVSGLLFCWFVVVVWCTVWIAWFGLIGWGGCWV